MKFSALKWSKRQSLQWKWQLTSYGPAIKIKVAVPVLTGMSKPAVEWETSSEIMDKIHQKEYCTGGTVLKTEYTGFIKLFSFPLIVLKARVNERQSWDPMSLGSVLQLLKK